MADLSYTVDVNVNSGMRSLDKLNDRIDSVSKSFGGMKTALLGIGLATAMTNAVRMADDLQDLSNATGIATGNLVEFKKALSTSGGQADQMAAALNVFVRSIDEAAQGSIKAQNAFQDAGVSLEDLRKLGERDLMIKTLEGISKIDDAGRRATLMMDKFGKSFKTVDPGELANKLRETAGEGDKYASAIKRAAELNDNLTTAQGNLSLALLMAFEPIILKINNFNSAMEESGIKAEGLVNVIKTLGIVLASSFALSFGLKLVATIGQVGRGLTVVAKQIDMIQGVAAGATGAMGGLFAATGKFMVALRGVVAVVAVFGTAIYAASQLFDDFGSVAVNALARMIEGIGSLIGMLGGGALGAAIGSAFGPIGTIVGGIAGGFAGDKLAELFGLNKLIDKARQAREEAEKAAAYAKKIGGGRGVVNPPLVGGGAPDARDVDTKARENAIRQIKEISGEYVKQQQQLQFRMGLEADIAGYGEDEKQRILAQADLTKGYVDLIDQLVKKKQTLSKEEEYLLPIINEQIASASKLYETQRQGLDAVISKQQLAAYAEKERQQVLEQITKQLERQASLGDQLVSANDKLVDVKFTGQQMGRNPLEKQFAQIQEDARKAALEAGRAFSAGFDGMDLTIAQSKELSDGLQQIAERYKVIADEQAKQLEQSRSWDQGWKTAFDNYMDNATNAAMRAGEVFGSITRNMESAIDKFVETGKFSFKDFAQSVIQDMIKIELKAQATKLLGAIGGGGGIFSAIGSLFGFADGGSPPVNKPSIVGEKGPELFVPRTAGTVVPNGGSMGPQNVTNNYITNQISALDSKSVAQMFAENRKTLLGTVQLAQKELPYSNR